MSAGVWAGCRGWPRPLRGRPSHYHAFSLREARASLVETERGGGSVDPTELADLATRTDNAALVIVAVQVALGRDSGDIARSSSACNARMTSRSTRPFYPPQQSRTCWAGPDRLASRRKRRSAVREHPDGRISAPCQGGGRGFESRRPLREPAGRRAERSLDRF